MRLRRHAKAAVVELLLDSVVLLRMAGSAIRPNKALRNRRRRILGFDEIAPDPRHGAR